MENIALEILQEAVPRDIFLKYLESVGKTEADVFKAETKPHVELPDFGTEISKPVAQILIKTQKAKVFNKIDPEPKGPKVSSSGGQASLMSFFGKK